MRLGYKARLWFEGLSDRGRIWLLFSTAVLLLFLSACSIINKPCVELCPPETICIGGICVPIATLTPTPTPVPEPPPLPTPVPTPVPEPTPTPVPVPTPTPTPPTPTPTPDIYPVRFPKPGTVIYMRNSRWNRGMDSTPRMLEDRELCELLHHVPVPSGDCHFDSDVWASSTQRGNYEALVLAGARDGEALPTRGLCPVWEFKSNTLTGRCHDDRVSVPVSCDHFGSVGNEDDPQTPGVFEGRPAVCGLQTDEFGPYAGFFMVPQCSPGIECTVRACGPMGQECAPWVTVTWRE